MAYESKSGQVTVANPNRDGTGTLVSIYTVTEVGGITIDGVRIVATVTTTDGMVRLFVDRGGTIRMLAEIPVTAKTVSATEPGYTSSLRLSNVNLENGDILKASTEKAEAINVFISYVS